MELYIELLLLLFVGMTPTVIAVVFLIHQNELQEGTAALILLFVTCICSSLALAMKFRQHYRTPIEEAEQDVLSTLPRDTSTGPPKYEQLYPDKIVVVPSSTNPASPSGLHFEPTLYVNPYSDNLVNPYPWQMGSSEEEDEEGLPSYTEAVLLSKQGQP